MKPTNTKEIKKSVLKELGEQFFTNDAYLAKKLKDFLSQALDRLEKQVREEEQMHCIKEKAAMEATHTQRETIWKADLAEAQAYKGKAKREWYMIGYNDASKKVKEETERKAFGEIMSMLPSSEEFFDRFMERYSQVVLTSRKEDE
jgi:hypothetical protein